MNKICVHFYVFKSEELVCTISFFVYLKPIDIEVILGKSA